MSVLGDVQDLDSWIKLLMTCKQLPESDVKKLCDKVSPSNQRYDQLSNKL